jgi:O-antigen/teichoic acid export membrane protein
METDQYQPTLIIQRIGLTAIARIIESTKGFVILPILTKVLGPGDYGIWTQILITVSLILPLIQFGLPFAMLRFLPSKEKKEIGQGIITCLTVILPASIILALAVFFLSDFATTNFLKEGSPELIQLASLLVIFQALSTAAHGAFRIFGQIKRYSLIVILETFLEVGLISYFVLSGYGLFGAIISLLITRGTFLVLALYLIISYAGITFPNFSIIRPYLKYSLPLVPTAIFSFLISSSDRYVINYYFDTVSVGIYSAAYNMPQVILIFHHLILYILAPIIYSHYDNKQTDMARNYLSYGWKYVLMFLFPAAFGVSVLGEPLLNYLTTAEFVSEGRIIIPIVALSLIAYSISSLFGIVARLSGRTGIIFTAFAGAAALNLGLNVLLVPRWGINAAAVTTLISYVAVAIIMYFRSNMLLKFNLQFNFILKSILSSVFMAAVIWVINPTSLLMMLICMPIGTILYFTILIILRGLSNNEIQIFLATIKKSIYLNR